MLTLLFLYLKVLCQDPALNHIDIADTDRGVIDIRAPNCSPLCDPFNKSQTKVELLPTFKFNLAFTEPPRVILTLLNLKNDQPDVRVDISVLDSSITPNNAILQVIRWESQAIEILSVQWIATTNPSIETHQEYIHANASENLVIKFQNQFLNPPYIVSFISCYNSRSYVTFQVTNVTVKGFQLKHKKHSGYTYQIVVFLYISQEPLMIRSVINVQSEYITAIPKDMGSYRNTKHWSKSFDYFRPQMSTLYCGYQYIDAMNDTAMLELDSKVDVSQKTVAITLVTSNAELQEPTTVNCVYLSLITCLDGYYLDNQRCLQCPTQCTKCDSITNCKECFLEQKYVLKNGRCICNSGFTEIVYFGCRPCHYQCAECKQGQQSSCIKCLKSRTLQGLFCTCKNGYYDDGENAECKACASTCQTCFDGGVKHCSSCWNQQFRVRSRGLSCDCQARYYEQGKDVCRSCLAQCATCTDGTTCLSCFSTENRRLVARLCPCIPEFVELNDICNGCHYSCASCFGKQVNECTTCKELRQLVESTCMCPSLTYDAGISTCQCNWRIPTIVCHYSCEFCTSHIAENCLACLASSFRVLSGGQCICPERGYYEEDGFQQCYRCNDRCEKCRGPYQDNCLSCYKSKFRYLLSGQCVCEQGYYLNAVDNCLACPEQCIRCDGESDLEKARLSSIVCKCDQDCLDIRAREAEVIHTLNSTYASLSNQQKASGMFIRIGEILGLFTLVIKSPQVVITYALLEYNQPELVYQTIRMISLFAMPGRLSHVQQQQNLTTFRIFGKDFTNQTLAEEEQLTKFRLFGISNISLYSTLSQYILFASWIIMIMFFRCTLKSFDWSLRISLIFKLVFESYFESQFLYFMVTQIHCVYNTLSFSSIESQDHIISIALSSLSLTVYILYIAYSGNYMYQYLASGRVNRLGQQPISQQFRFFLRDKKLDHQCCYFYTIGTQLKKLAIALILVSNSEMVLSQLMLIGTLQFLHILVSLLINPYEFRILHVFELTLLLISFTLTSLSIIDYQSSMTLSEFSRSGETLSTFILILISVDMVKFCVKIILIFKTNTYVPSNQFTQNSAILKHG